MGAQARAGQLVVRAAPGERAIFIRRTYAHLALAILALVAVEWALLQLPGVNSFARQMSARYNWFIVLAAFLAVSHVADRWARSNTSQLTQYMGLGLYVLAQAILLLPLLARASRGGLGDVVLAAGLITLMMFAGLTCVAVVTRQDFSFLRGALALGGFVALGAIGASITFGYSLGLLFSAGMVALASASILYNTSNIMRRYRTEQHVAASLALFASLSLLFRYVARVMMQSQRRR